MSEKRNHVNSLGIFRIRSRKQTLALSCNGDEADVTARFRDRVISEIVHTEKSYLRDLYTLFMNYIQPLKSSQRYTEHIPTASLGDIQVIFSTVDLILQGNTEFLDNLTTSVRRNEDRIGEHFLSLADSLHFYSVYCNHNEAAMQTVRLLYKYPEFQKFLGRARQRTGVTHDIIDYMVKPFQRMLKYPLLLKELLKYTPQDHADFNNIVKALKKIECVVDEINSNKLKSDNLKKMLEINDSIIMAKKKQASFLLMHPNRIFIKEGKLAKISHGRSQERFFFLFNDMLIYGKQIGSKYQLKGKISLSNIEVENIPEGAGYSNSFKITRFDKKTYSSRAGASRIGYIHRNHNIKKSAASYILCCSSEFEKDAWLKALISQLQVCQTFNLYHHPLEENFDVGLVRIYHSETDFYSFAINQEMLVKELKKLYLQKAKLKDIKIENLRLVIVREGQQNTVVPNDSSPLKDQVRLMKDGLEFGTRKNHFLMLFN